jgi:hypothetical protein
MPEGEPALHQRGELRLGPLQPPGHRVGGVEDTPLRGGGWSWHGVLLPVGPCRDVDSAEITWRV